VKSIRIFLVAGIVATLTLFNFVAALRGFQTSMREADMLFDNQLLDLSQLVTNLDMQRVSRDFRLGNNLAFQVWENDKLLVASFHAPQAPINDFAGGFGFANFDGYRWRTYTRQDSQQGRWIIVAERSDLRFTLAENVVLESVAPILLGIPIAALLVWIIVSRGLKPLKLLSAELRNKQVHDLAPLQQSSIPAELDQVVQSINGFISRLNSTLEREQRFSADAAHELRTPISALKVQLHNLAQEVDTRSASFHELSQGVERLQHLVEQLLSLYRSSPAQFAATCTRVDLHEITQDVVARHYGLIESRRQVLALEGDRTMIIGDRFALETLVANLLTNAAKYTPAGGTILLRTATDNDGPYLLVEDSGPGIAAADREHIFERFYRTNDIGNESIPGCGLGLAIVQHVAELHRARIEVGRSGFADGSAFKVSFPEPADAA
jgi:two-component system, OmpR family, sensor histidine kinase QseC